MAVNMSVSPILIPLAGLVPSDYHLSRSMQHVLEGKLLIECEEVKTDIKLFLCIKVQWG